MPYLVWLLVWLVPGQLLAAEATPSTLGLHGEAQRQGYALGMDIGHALKTMNPDFKVEMVLRGIKDAFTGEKELLLTSKQAFQVRSEFAQSRHVGAAASVSGGKDPHGVGPGAGAEEKKESGATPALKDFSEKLGYAMGMDIGYSQKRKHPDLTLTMFLQGMKDVLSGSAKPLLTYDQASQALLALSQAEKKAEETIPADSQAKNELLKLRGERENMINRNQAEEKKFLERNKETLGVKSTASGLQYIVIKEGKGGIPKGSDIVTLRYTGTLVDNTPVGGSDPQKPEANFPVDKLILGLQEALSLMKVGGELRAFVPSALAYGRQGTLPSIGPYRTLIFKIELLGIVDQKKGKNVVLSNAVPPLKEKKVEPVALPAEPGGNIPNIDPEEISLASAEGAAATFMTLRNSIMPSTPPQNIERLCKVVSTDSFMDGCRKYLGDYLASLVGHGDELQGGDFGGGQMTKVEGMENTMQATWQERLLFRNDRKVVSDHRLTLQAVQVGKEWRISKVEE